LEQGSVIGQTEQRYEVPKGRFHSHARLRGKDMTLKRNFSAKLLNPDPVHPIKKSLQTAARMRG
jgi:hypothetical protein